MLRQRIDRGFRRGQRLDVETFEQCARPECGLLQLAGDQVVEAIGIARIQPLLDAEQRRKAVLHPQPGRRAAEQVPVARQQAPDRARIALGRAAVGTRHAQRLERHALAVEHPEDVVVRDHEQGRRIAERLVAGEPGRIAMTVRADDRQRCHLAIQAPGDRPRILLRREQDVGMRHDSLLRNSAPVY